MLGFLEMVLAPVCGGRRGPRWPFQQARWPSGSSATPDEVSSTWSVSSFSSLGLVLPPSHRVSRSVLFFTVFLRVCADACTHARPVSAQHLCVHNSIPRNELICLGMRHSKVWAITTKATLATAPASAFDIGKTSSHLENISTMSKQYLPPLAFSLMKSILRWSDGLSGGWWACF